MLQIAGITFHQFFKWNQIFTSEQQNIEKQIVWYNSPICKSLQIELNAIVNQDEVIFSVTSFFIFRFSTSIYLCLLTFCKFVVFINVGIQNLWIKRDISFTTSKVKNDYVKPVLSVPNCLGRITNRYHQFLLAKP